MGWDGFTRGIRYDKDKVAEACRRKAEAAETEHEREHWLSEARAVEEGRCHPKEVARDLLVEEESQYALRDLLGVGDPE